MAIRWMRVRSFLHSVLAWLAGIITTALGGPTPTDQALEAASRLVINQCRRASLAGGSYWTSQPGALRTFERDKASPLALYKLFSSLEQMPGFWARHRLTGDNSKERAYANIYPHLTTRSFS